MFIKGLSARNLKLFKQFYQNYSSIGKIISDSKNEPIMHTVSAQLAELILLVADKDRALVKYATAGMDKIFCTTISCSITRKRELEKYIGKELKKLK